jgi:hypothetical protein
VTIGVGRSLKNAAATLVGFRLSKKPKPANDALRSPRHTNTVSTASKEMLNFPKQRHIPHKFLTSQLNGFCTDLTVFNDNDVITSFQTIIVPVAEIANYQCPETRKTILSTAFERKMTKQNEELIRLLLSRDTDPCIADPDGTTAWMKSMQLEYRSAWMLDQSESCHSNVDANGRSALWWAVARWERITGAMYLPLFRTLRNVADANGVTPLMLAAYLGKADTVSQLLKGYPDVYAQDKTGRNVLHYLLEDQVGKTLTEGYSIALMLREHGFDIRDFNLDFALPMNTIDDLAPAWMIERDRK